MSEETERERESMIEKETERESMIENRQELRNRKRRDKKRKIAIRHTKRERD